MATFRGQVRLVVKSEYAISAERTAIMTFHLEEINLIVRAVRHPRHRIHLGLLLNDCAFIELAAIAEENTESPSQKRFTGGTICVRICKYTSKSSTSPKSV